MNSLLRFITILAALFNLYLFSQEVYICIWRNPERTMKRIFPDAFDYKTRNIKISKEKRKKIEERLGRPLLPGQRENFTYYELYGKRKELVGYILAVSQKGEYGAIELVFGLDKEKKIKDIYIQRAREKDKEFKKKEFLTLFRGVGIKDEGRLEDIFKGERTFAQKAVTLGVRKELIAFEELVLKR